MFLTKYLIKNLFHSQNVSTIFYTYAIMLVWRLSFQINKIFVLQLRAQINSYNLKCDKVGVNI